MPPRRQQSVWKSFSDLAMGLMAVFVLVLVVLLYQQDKQTAALAKAQDETKHALEEAQKQKVLAENQKLLAQKQTVLAENQKEKIEALLKRLTEERGEFAIELIELFDTTYRMVQAQDGAERWLSAVFEEGPCKLRMTERGELVIASGDFRTKAASLYESGRFEMSLAGRRALGSCKANFLKLAYCLAPTRDVPQVVLARRNVFCGDVQPAAGASPIDELRRGVEALTLEGNTDRIPITGGTPRIRTEGHDLAFETVSGESFVENAYLGAERARQALGNLISLVEGEDADNWDALQIMMSRLRVESPSYGRYQAGPPAWREEGCEGEPNGCAAARNLSLRVRWKKEALRAPFEKVREKICGLLSDPELAFAKGLVGQGRDLAKERQRFGCPPAAGEP